MLFSEGLVGAQLHKAPSPLQRARYLARGDPNLHLFCSLVKAWLVHDYTKHPPLCYVPTTRHVEMLTCTYFVLQ
jgi:hypothetical protein